MAPLARGAAIQNLHVCATFHHSHLSLVPLMPIANFDMGKDGYIQRATLSLESWSGQACFREGGMQTQGSPCSKFAQGQAVHSSASSVPCLQALQAQDRPQAWSLLSLSEGSLQKCYMSSLFKHR